MTLMTSARSRLPWRRFSTMASGASRISANARARLANPRSVTTTHSVEVLVDEVAAEHVDRGQLVDRDVEEPLDLALVEVHRQHPVRARDGDHVGDQAGGDRHPRLVLLVRAAVGVVRDDRRDPAGRRPLEGVDHDQELHDRLVDRAAGRLDEEHVLLADVVQDAHEDVLVRELEDLGLTRLAVQPVGDLPRQLGVGVAVVDLELVRVHGCLPLAEGGHDERPDPCPSDPPPSGWGSSLSPMPPRSASPGGTPRSRRPGPPRPGASRSRRARSTSSG